MRPKMRIRFSLAVVALCFAAWVAPGCKPNAVQSDTQDEKNPYYQRAKSKLQERDYKDAVRNFHLALEMNPRNAAAHLELGLLYEEKLQDYSYAIYHYRRYLELRPGAEKADLVKQFVERSKLALAATIANTPLDSGEEIARLRQENSILLQQVESLSRTNEVLELKMAQLQSIPAESRAPIIVQTNVYVVPTRTNVVQASAGSNSDPKSEQVEPPDPPKPPPAAAPRKYIVQKGDTLYAISLKVYGRKDKWMVIYQANKSAIGPPPSYTLRVGQTLTIPKI